jgi:hypothetical protein
MARFRSDRLTRASVEHLLDGHRGMPASRALYVLVAAGRAPAHRGELAGEESAVAAFRAAAPAGVAASAGAAAPAVPLRRSLTRLLTMKLVAAAAVVAGGGLAVAAATGALPSVPFLAEAPPSQGVGSAGSGSGPGGAPPSPSGTGPTGGLGSPRGPGMPGGPGTPGQVPAASVPGLCRALLTMPVGQGRRALTTPPFADLVAAAGSVGAARAYCAELVSPSATAPAPPPPNGAPTDSPAAANSPKAPKSPKAVSTGKATTEHPDPGP